MKNIKKQILDVNESDSFLKELYKIYLQERNDSTVFYKTIISLHNDGEINFTEEILKISIQDHNFFDAKNMFEEVLPDLDIPIQKSMNCVKHIFQLSGNDMSAGMGFSSFVEYCEKDDTQKDNKTTQLKSSTYIWSNFKIAINKLIVHIQKSCKKGFRRI